MARDRPGARVPRAARALLLALAGALLALGPAVAADAPEHWSATSTTSMAVTGNVTFAPDKVTFQDGRSLPLSLVGHVSGFRGMGETVEATLYRVTVPADLRLENGNHLCGGGRHSVPVTYIAVWTPTPLPGDTAPRAMAAFSGKGRPRSAGGPSSCGVYGYDAGG